MENLDSKRLFLIEKIKYADEKVIDTILEYDFFNNNDNKVSKIVDGLKPFITLLYLTLDENQLDQLFNKTI